MDKLIVVVVTLDEIIITTTSFHYYIIVSLYYLGKLLPNTWSRGNVFTNGSGARGDTLPHRLRLWLVFILSFLLASHAYTNMRRMRSALTSLL